MSQPHSFAQGCPRCGTLMLLYRTLALKQAGEDSFGHMGSLVKCPSCDATLVSRLSNAGEGIPSWLMLACAALLLAIALTRWTDFAPPLVEGVLVLVPLGVMVSGIFWRSHVRSRAATNAPCVLEDITGDVERIAQYRMNAPEPYRPSKLGETVDE